MVSTSSRHLVLLGLATAHTWGKKSADLCVAGAERGWERQELGKEKGMKDRRFRTKANAHSR